MPIELRCNVCAAALRAADGMAGRVVRCGKCGATSRVPVAATPPAAPEPAAPEPQVEGAPAAKPASRTEARVYGTPGPARRPRAKRPAPLSTLKALAAVALVVGLVFAGCGYALWRVANRPADWRAHQSPSGGFTVDLPAAPRNDLGGGLRPGSGMVAEGTTHRGTEYVVVWGEYPGGRNPAVGDEDIIRAAIDGMKSEVQGGRVTAEEPARVGPFTAREFVMEAPGGETGVFRVVVTAERIYVVGAGGRTGGRDDPNVRRFIDSFEVTHPGSVARARERAEADERRRAAERERQEEARRAAKLREHEEATRAADTAFQSRPYSGSTPPSPNVLSHVPNEAFGYAFEPSGLNTVVVQPEQLPVSSYTGILQDILSGEGVRGKAAYLTQRSGRVVLKGRGWPDDTTPFTAAQRSGGLTVAGWVRVRYQPVTVVSVFEEDSASTDPPLAEVTVGRTHVTATVTGPDGPIELKRPWARDDGWHHVALVRDTKSDGAGVRLYLDGALVASPTAKPTALPKLCRVSLGWLKYPDADWPGPLDASGNPGPVARDVPVGAVDDCALVGRALTEADIRALMGIAPPGDVADRSEPPPPIGLTFKPTRQLGAVAATAFDPARGLVWVVDEAPLGAPTRLRKLSYPGFEERATYTLSGAVTAAGFDLPRNRLYLAVCDRRPDAAPGHLDWVQGLGALHRYDLERLAGDEGKRIEPTAEGRERLFVRGIVVAPDGKTVYVTGTPPELENDRSFRVAHVGHLYRTSETLGAIEQFPAPGHFGCLNRIALSPDGATLKLAMRDGLGSPYHNSAFNFVRVNARAWNAGGVVRTVSGSGEPVLDWVPLGERHAFVNSFFGKRLFPGDSGQPARQFLGAIAASQYVISSESEPDKKNTVRVYCTHGKNEQRGAWKVHAELTASADVRVGGPFWVSPDGKFLVFRPGQVVALESALDLAPDPGAVGRMVAARPDPTVLPLAPRPRERLPFGPVPRATDVKGLKLYLDCDALDDGVVRDAVSKKAAGTLNDGHLTEGVRGKGLRLTSKGGYTRAGAGLALDPALLDVGADEPFTLALWARVTDLPIGPILIGRRPRDGWEVPRLSIGTMRAPQPVLELMVMDWERKHSTGNGTPAPPVDAWAHVALSRGARNELRFYVDGKLVDDRKKPLTFAAALRGDEYGLVHSATARLTMDVDEFCLFDRALTEEEIARLAGRADR